MKRLFLDTETNGLPLWKKPSDLPEQPHIVQIAARLKAYNGDLLSSINLLVKPDGWTIPPECVKLNGITTDIAAAGGVPEVDAVNILWHLIEQADLLIIFNVVFDKRIIRIALKRLGDEERMAALKAMESYCTMQNSRKLVAMPATVAMHKTHRHGAKTPKLEEAYRHFTGKEMENAHNAAYDVLACEAVYWGIMAAEGIDEPGQESGELPQARIAAPAGQTTEAEAPPLESDGDQPSII